MTLERERIDRILEGFDPVAQGLPEDFILTKLTAMKGCGCKVPRAILMDLLKTFGSDVVIDSDGVGIGLDSCVVPLRHKGLNLVQTTDFFYPLVDDPYLMGRVTCANVLSDLYAMGIVDCDNMLMLLGVAVELSEKERDIIISMFIRGFKDTADSAETKVRGGQTVRCPWLLLGGVASSVAADEEIIKVDQAQPGDLLILTKPIGGQVAVNSYEWLKKKNGRVEELGLDENKIVRAFQQVTEQMTRLNRNAARMLHKYHAHASTDVTGFGLLGHADNLSRAQKANVRFVIDTLPVIEYMDEIALKMPNRNGFNLFGGTSAETSGGLLVAVSPFIRDMESVDGFPAWVVGHVEALNGEDNHASSTRNTSVPTSDEEKAAKEKERATKLKVFCTVRDRIFEKRAKGELDDEILSLTQRLLEKNPDIYTFWNIRRETIEKKIKEWEECVSTTEDESCKENCKKKIENLLSGELFLTQACLEENHKSYAACFPPVVGLCVAKSIRTSNAKIFPHMGSSSRCCEVRFSNRLIAQNFSNYSAWHYRAVLLPKIQNAKTGEFRLDDTVIASELKKVTSAFFTDPDDQIRPDSATPAVPLSVSFHDNNTTFVMSKACTFNELLPFVSALSAQPASARIWLCMSDVPCTVRLTVDDENVVDISKKPYVNKELLRKAFDLTTRKPNVAITTITDNCKQLMEMEPKNPWARYMYTLCLMETRPAECHSEILENLGKLATELDVKRKEIYKKLASRQILNRVLREHVDGNPLLEHLMDGKHSELAIRNAQLSSLDGVELLAGLITQLDVSGNQLTTLDEVLLPNLESLTANENPITRVSTTSTFCNLKFLSLGACQLDQVECVLPALKGMCSLERFLYCETPLVEKSKELQEGLPSIRLIPYYL
ncbi:selenide, water dikinase [Ostertagia ostertagi]